MINSASFNSSTSISLPVWQSLTQAITASYQPQRVVIITDHYQPLLSSSIGYSIECWPGQSISVACGVVTANPALKVFVVTTADQAYGAGLTQLTEAMRCNHNLVVVVSDSWDYSLTSAKVNPIHMALAAGATFIARGFAGDPLQLQNLLTMAAKHDGLSLVDVLQPQSLPNQSRTFAWYRQHIHDLQDKPNALWPTKDQLKVYQLAQSWENGIATGLIYQRRTASYQTQLLKRLPIPLVDQPLKNPGLRVILNKLK